MKRNMERIERERTLPKPDRLNREGFPAYERTVEEDVLAVLTTGSTANLFYARATENVKEMLDVLRKCEDLEFLAKAVIYAREKGFTRTLPIAGLVEISRRDPALFRKIADRICQNPHDWQQFIDICRSKTVRQGLGRAVKEVILKAIAGMSEYHAMKYPRAVEDMINISHPHESLNPAIIRYIKKKEHEGEQFRYLKILKTSENEDEIIQAITDGRLPYEVVAGSVKRMTPRIWEALLYQAPYFNLIRNLNNFGRNGVFDSMENLDYAVRRITDEKAIRQSKLFPFRFYVAYQMLGDFRGAERLGNALQIALEKSVTNIPELDGKVAIASDVSGSMSSNLTGDYSVVQCYDLVGLFTGCLVKKCRELPIVLPFEWDVREDIASQVYEKETVMKIASCFGAWGGTSLSAPVEWLIRRREAVDYFIAFTDNEEWVGRSFIEAWTEYREIAPECKAYLVTLLPYRDYPVPPEMNDVHFIFGWSDAVLRYITTDPADQMREVVEIEI
ncbi:MAG TPA: TROVE domain-containing protein [Candidatus Syntrophoarchaeum butanivorans]|uniref:TROVE domain-containing protein n=1 Tax=Candidatus Syntropharchaeum butanivorans TaxID=1839936 RepID=A0A7C1AVJ5_9EURY|nr:TROVE domain-containing protein [Candidatus Syntrophoarchaeum butanivorans]